MYAKGLTDDHTLKDSIAAWISANVNDLPLEFGEIIDRIERMREELLTLQRSLEKVELSASEDGAAKWDQES